MAVQSLPLPLPLLIPGLPNDLSSIILSLIPLPFHSLLKLTSKSWLVFFSSPSLLSTLRPSFLSPLHLSHLLCIFPDDPSLSSPYLLDALHLAWCPLPPMPINPHGYSLSNFSALALGTHLYVIGGSLFDTRSFPIDRPTPTSDAFRFDFATRTWESISPMTHPRGSFACGVVAAGGSQGKRIVVAGGGSRHPMFGAAGSRLGFVEGYDVDTDEWVQMPGLPGFRAGCVGLCVKEKEFWVMGGYGESRTISGVFPIDEYYRDVVVLDLEGEEEGEIGWREVGDMWEPGERMQLGKVVVVEDDEGDKVPEIFMLDGNEIFRYNMSLNRWFCESTVPRPAQDGSAFGFVALRGELYVMSHLQGFDLSEIRRSRQRKKGSVLSMQIYNPRNKSWRYIATTTPFNVPLNFRSTVMCTVRV